MYSFYSLNFYLLYRMLKYLSSLFLSIMYMLYLLATGYDRKKVLSLPVHGSLEWNRRLGVLNISKILMLILIMLNLHCSQFDIYINVILFVSSRLQVTSVLFLHYFICCLIWHDNWPCNVIAMILKSLLSDRCIY